MKLVRYGQPGAECPGILDSRRQIRDLSAHVRDIDGPALQAGAIAQIAALNLEALPLVEEGTRLGPCIGGVSKIICIGLNYLDHALEGGARNSERAGALSEGDYIDNRT